MTTKTAVPSLDNLVDVMCASMDKAAAKEADARLLPRAAYAEAEVLGQVALQDGAVVRAHYDKSKKYVTVEINFSKEAFDALVKPLLDKIGHRLLEGWKTIKRNDQLIGFDMVWRIGEERRAVELSEDTSDLG